MNALNLLSARLVGSAASADGPSAIPRRRGREHVRGRSWFSAQRRPTPADETRTDRDKAYEPSTESRTQEDHPVATAGPPQDRNVAETATLTDEEKGPSSDGSGAEPPPEAGVARSNGREVRSRRLLDALIASIKWICSTLAGPGLYIVTCMSDEHGRFSPSLPIRRTSRILVRLWRSRSTSQAVGLSASADETPSSRNKRVGLARLRSHQRLPSDDGSVNGSAVSGADVPDDCSSKTCADHPARRRTASRGSWSTSSDERPTGRRSIRISVAHENAPRRRPSRTTDGPPWRGSDAAEASLGPEPPVTPATLKSPTSPATSLGMSRYPRAPVPPRPLIPRRRPSNLMPGLDLSDPSLKTLILDLDETLIHSLAKGGRMSTGHMVEVKLNATVARPGTAALGPQHPILYYVHKRPHCDEFLRKVCKWYKLVIFTASVQEYADPVIDWLEQDRKYFIRRYYRQDCTFRGGNYIKDLSRVEPNLSQVMIVDNSPASYVFHPDNAIPIEGWINDPTDNHLLHLIPLLEGLQYATDVRALLALRMGEAFTVASP